MQNPTLWSAVSLSLVCAAVAAHFGVHRLDIARVQRLPVETFPLQIGAWQGGGLQPVDPEVRAKLPSATIIERNYSAAGQAPIDLMLLTAKNSDDLHDPNTCFPSQGWHLTRQHQEKINGQSVTVMEAALDDQRITVMYWMTGYYAPKPPANPLIRQIADARTRLIGRHEGQSLFVRLITPTSAIGNQTLEQFTRQIQPSVQRLVDIGRVAANARKA